MNRPPALERIYRGPEANFLVLGRADVGVVVPEVPYAVISITDPSAPEAELAASPLRRAVLRLKFNDIGEGPSHGEYVSMAEADAQAILAFYLQHRGEIDLLICHCESGASRSAGVAAALSQIVQDEDMYFFRNYTPNLHVYDTLLRVNIENQTAMNPETVTLYRPIGQKELDLIRDSGFTAFPPRLSWQPIFYPVLNEEYATQIARDWNIKDAASDYVGDVTRFQVEADFVSRYPVQVVGGSEHQEYWVPSEELDEFNRHLVGPIEVIAEYRVTE
jgi:predicted protein tyrosine phosphatase